MVKIKFSSGKNGPFYQRVDGLVTQYFAQNSISKTGNTALHTKTVILLTLLVVIYVLVVFIIPPSLLSLILCALEGAVFAGIGFNVMHDGNHGSYSTNKRTNMLMSLTLNLLGGINFFWTEKHNFKHHSYVNVQGYDEDIDFGPLVRMSPEQKRRWWHRAQAFYLVPLYAIFYFGWISVLDFSKYIKKSFSEKGLTSQEHANFWITKIVYALVWLVIPVTHLGMVALLGYLVTGSVCSVIISFVFQLAHVVEEAEFLVPNTEGVLPCEFALGQVRSTNNFSRGNKIVTWFVGGLNYQIEHHLFPNISHVHYPAISPLVQTVCKEYSEAYHCSPTLWSAIVSHMKHLHRLGQK